jgi:hypothetical protein
MDSSYNKVYEVAHIEFKRMIIRMINEIKKHTTKYLNEFKENIDELLNETKYTKQDMKDKFKRARNPETIALKIWKQKSQ